MYKKELNSQPNNNRSVANTTGRGLSMPAVPVHKKESQTGYKTSVNQSTQLVTQRFLAAGDDYFNSNDFVIVNDIGQFLKRGHVVVKLSELGSAVWPPSERMLVITGHGDENAIAGHDSAGVADLIRSSAVPEAIPIVLLSCSSAKDKGSGSSFTKEVYDALNHKRTISGFKGAAILDASSQVMKIVSIRHDKEQEVSETQTALEGKHEPQESINRHAFGKEKNNKFYKDAADLAGVAGFFNEFLTAINDSIDEGGCVTYPRY